MLVPSPRHRPADLRLWSDLEAADHEAGKRLESGRKPAEALRDLRAFASAGPCYAGVSWGKDSTVVAHLAWRLEQSHGVRVPLVWVRVEPIVSPECADVAAAFLGRFGVDYAEIVRQCRVDETGVHATGTLEAGFAEAEERFGGRHVSGIRAEESGSRKLRCLRWGVSTSKTCAPLARWTTGDVFAYLAHHGLPVHPVYAMLGGGRWPREHLRVASIGGKRGQGMGRAEWEREYYPEIVRRIGG